MINLYSKTTSIFDNNGEATLRPLECFFSCALNGVWQLEMTLPYDQEEKYKLIDYDKILKITGIDAVVEQTSAYQLFRIYDYRKGDDNVYILAYPIGLDARYDTYGTITAYDKTPAQAISQINGVSQKYTVSTDITDTDTYSMAWANTNIIAMLNGDDSFVNTFGGEIVYDNYNIKVNDSLGRDTGAPEVRYGKNIMGMEIEYDISNVITRLYPIAKSGEALNAIAEYQQGAYPYVDADNSDDYPVPHISTINTPFSITQLSDDGSNTYSKSIEMYGAVKAYASQWLYNALTGVDTGLFDAWLKGHELKWLVDYYAFTMINDGTEGIVEDLWRKTINATGYVIRSGSVQSLIYNAMKEGFEDVLKNDESAVYVGSATKQLKAVPNNKYIYTYSWDSNGDFRTKPHAGESYAWVYANNKWNQLDSNGETTGLTDSATWKWYKVSGKSFKRYGNKKKKRYLQGQWWEISGVWYWFDNDGHGISGSSMMADAILEFESWTVDSKTIVETLAPSCKTYEGQLFSILYNNMINYCNMLFEEDGLSYPTPKINIDVVDLSKTTEYEGLSDMLTIKLGDTVKCTNAKLGITTDLRVTGVTFDVLRGYNSQLTIGQTENSVIQLLDAIGKDKSGFHGYTAGEGILINGQTISAIPQDGKIKDVTINGQSVVFGGKANIDLDSIMGEGLQWFEETEDALFGVTDDIVTKMVDDGIYRGSVIYEDAKPRAEYWLYVSPNAVAIMLPMATQEKPYNVLTLVPHTLNYGGIFLMSKSTDDLGALYRCMSYDYLPPIDFRGETGWSGEDEETPINIKMMDTTTGSQTVRNSPHFAVSSHAEVDGETWYGLYICQSGYANLPDFGWTSIEEYVSIEEIPNHGGVVGFANVAELISVCATQTKTIEWQKFNGISREGYLAFFAGGTDEHGTDAPIRIYSDGTYEGIGGNVDDVKIDGTSIVTSKVANIPTLTGATSQADGSKGLVPAPLIADRSKFLKADGTWDEPGGGYTEVTGTLTAGSTTLTLSNDSIGTSKTFEFFTDTFGVSPTAISVESGAMTLTFESRSSDLSVKVRVS